MATETMTVESAKVPDVKVEFPYNLGDNIKDAESLFGEAAVWSNYLRGATIEVQNVARRMLVAKKTPAEIQEFMSTYKLGTGVKLSAPITADSAKTAILSGAVEMSPEELAALINELKQKAKARG